MGYHDIFLQLFRDLACSSEAAVSPAGGCCGGLYLYVWSEHGGPDRSYPARATIYGAGRLLDGIALPGHRITKISSVATRRLRLPDLSRNLYRLFPDSLAHPFLCGLIPDPTAVDGSFFVHRSLRARPGFAPRRRVCFVLHRIRVGPFASGNSLLPDATTAGAPVLGRNRDDAASLAIVFLWARFNYLGDHLSADGS
jgi:hypothetical protein